MLLGSVFVNAAFGGTVAHITRGRSLPSLPHDPNTTSYCSWWVDLSSAQSCPSLISDNAITLDTFRRWVTTERDTLKHALLLT
jgi:hypothetical protein